jgi:hypothetical protein
VEPAARARCGDAAGRGKRLRRLADELDAEADYLESRQSTPGASQCEPAPGVAASLEVAE